MDRTRSSLFYIAGYLLAGGLGLALAPAASLTLLGSNGRYPEILVRSAGVLMLLLGTLLVQVIRLRSRRWYPATAAVGLLVLVALSISYLATEDPLMLVLFAVVGLGAAGTLAGRLLDRLPAPNNVAKKNEK